MTIARKLFHPARITWEGETDHTAESLIGRDRDDAATQGKAASLGRMIRELVEVNGGQMLARDGYRALEAEGIDCDAQRNLIARARAKVGVETVKDGMTGGWVWKVAR